MYRWAQDADKQAVMDLWAVDFENYQPYYSWYFDTVYRPERTLCDFSGGRLAAMLQVAPYTLALRGAALPVCYIVGVITDPEYRGQGRGHALLGEAQRWLERQGYAAALLYTDIPGFYQPVGFSHCYARQTLTSPSRGFSWPPAEPALPLREGDLRRSIPLLQEVYQRMTERYDGYICRTEQNWRNYLGEQACDGARLLLAEGRAYALYTLDADKLHIVELGFSDEAALAAALAAASRQTQAAGLARLTWPAPYDAPQLLPQLAAAYWQPAPFVMARLLDWRAALSACVYPERVKAALNLTVLDHGQTKSASLRVAGGQGRVGEKEPGLAELCLEISALTELVFGLSGAAEALTGASAETGAVLKRLFPPRPGWINEYT